MPDKELRLRIITGFAIGLVVIGVTLWGVIPSYVLVMVILIGSTVEFFRMRLAQNNHAVFLPALISIMPVVYSLSRLLQRALSDDLSSVVELGEVLITLCLSFILYFLFSLKVEIDSLVNRLLSFSLSIFLITIPCIFALYVCSLTPKLLLGVFILLWSSDVFAYFGGKAFGRHKLAPSISPKKTWEGFASGFIATVLTSWGVSYLFPEIGVKDWIITGLLVVVFGTLGDLLQSAVKRHAGVKDSGRILPGHGGIWDRFDSFLGCMPWIGAYYLLM